MKKLNIKLARVVEFPDEGRREIQIIGAKLTLDNDIELNDFMPGDRSILSIDAKTLKTVNGPWQIKTITPLDDNKFVNGKIKHRKEIMDIAEKIPVG